jgi:hypothetical protein
MTDDRDDDVVTTMDREEGAAPAAEAPAAPAEVPAVPTQTPPPPPPRTAHMLAVSRCNEEDCECDHVYLALADEAGNVIAQATLKAVEAYPIAQDLCDAADQARDRRQAMRAARPRKH